ncbi:MAG TPA: hypothetical protein VN882_12415, partial [Steroidobacteraceae bacterium]|nr:hypothetical protein [Steroidobacteraceae bacterium]
MQLSFEFAAIAVAGGLLAAAGVVHAQTSPAPGSSAQSSPTQTGSTPSTPGTPAGNATTAAPGEPGQPAPTPAAQRPTKPGGPVIVEASRERYNRETRYQHSLPEVDGTTITVTKRT